jgi:hypothetical protein
MRRGAGRAGARGAVVGAGSVPALLVLLVLGGGAESMGATPPPVAAPPAEAGCVPPCEAGQTCYRATCMVAAPPAAADCAPPCAAGQTCFRGTCMVPAPAQHHPYPAPAYTYPPAALAATQPPVASRPAAPVLPARSRLVLLPFAGMHAFLGESKSRQGIGGHLGALVGGRFTRSLSLSGEVAFDWLNPEPASGASAFGVEVMVAASPLYHVPIGKLELVVGPKLGYWVGFAESTLGDRTTDARVDGVALGGNLGLFGPITRAISIGGLAALDVRTVRETCATIMGEPQACTGGSAVASDNLISLSVAVLH